MKVVFHFDGSEALAAKVKPLGIELCPESGAGCVTAIAYFSIHRKCHAS